MPHRLHARLGGLILLTLLGLGCDEPVPETAPAASNDEILQAWPWVGGERRAAVRGPEPGSTLSFGVPNGSKRVSLSVAAIRRGGLPLRRGARVRLRAGSATTEAVVPVRAPESGGWTSLRLELPEGVETLNLEAAPGGADLLWWSRPQFEGAGRSGRRNLLLVSLDTTRADAVGHLGQLHDTTPNLDGLAARGTTWTQAIAPSSWTLPTHVSVMTGHYPSWHGHTALDRRHGPPLPTLARLLGDAGWETAAFTGEGFISFTYGPTRDFDLIVEHPHTRIHRWWRPDDVPEASVSAAAAARWLHDREERGTDAPFFLFWHTYEPHSPYTDERFVGATAALPPGVDESAREEWQRYLGDLAVADRALGGILDTLESLGLSESTDVIVFSDHGEEFGEHSGGGLGPDQRHGHGSWDTLLRVPLIVASPTIEPGTRHEQVSLLDVFPTALACAGLTPPPSHGRPLQVPGGHASVGAEALNPQWTEAEEKAWRTSGGLKYLARLGRPPSEELRDLKRDPLEERDLSSKHPDELAALREEALAFFASAPDEWAARSRSDEAQAPGDLPPAVLESLRSLGYVE